MFEKFESFSKDRDKEKKKRALMFKLYNNKRTHITQVMFYYSRAIYREEEEKKNMV